MKKFLLAIFVFFITILYASAAKPLIYPFHTLSDLAGFVCASNNIALDFQDGYLKATNKTNDPSFNKQFYGDEQFSAKDYPILKIRFKPLVENGNSYTGQIFFNTDTATMGEDPGTYYNFNFKADNDWQEVIVDLTKVKDLRWSGKIKVFRYDPVAFNNDFIDILIDYIGFFSTLDQANNFSLGNDFPPSNSQTVTYSSGFQNVIIPANTIKSSDKYDNFVIKNVDIENPLNIAGGPIVFFDDGKNQRPVPLSYSNDTNITYVASQSGRYLLKYYNKSYDDVDGHWAYSTIAFTSNRKLFQGTSDNKFSPEAVMTRGMFVSVLGRMHMTDERLYNDDVKFDDVNKSEYYFPYVNWALKNSIIPETDNFYPENPITRSDMAIMIYNYLNAFSYNLEQIALPLNFDDIVSLDAYTQNAISSIQKMGIVNGKARGIFDPSGMCTRAEIATVFAKLIKLILGYEPVFDELSKSSMIGMKLPEKRFRIAACTPYLLQTNFKLGEKQVRELDECGIDIALIGYDGFSSLPDFFQKSVFKLHEQYGIEYFYYDTSTVKFSQKSGAQLYDSKCVNNVWYSDSPGFIGGAYADEPGTECMPELGETLEEYKIDFPGKIPFINLLPMYASAAQLTGGSWQGADSPYSSSTTTYKQYLDDYVKYVDIPYISVDIYPCNINEETYSDYVKNIELVADACRNSGREFWICIQSCSWAPLYREPDRTDMYWQAYTMLSFGAKAFIYYVLNERPAHTGTPIDLDGNKTQLWYDVKDLNHEVRRLEPIYMQYKNLGAYTHNVTTQNAPYSLMYNPYTDFSNVITKISSSSPLLIGCFEKECGIGYAFTLVNMTNLATPTSASIKLKINGTVVTAYPGGYSTVLTPDNEGYYNINLDNGMGVFITVE